MTLEQAADLSGRLSNVNGSIRLVAAHVGGGIETAWEISRSGAIHASRADFW